MKPILVLTTLLTTFQTAVASKAIITNQCASPIYLWSVGSTIGPKVLLPSNSSYSEDIHVDTRTGGIALKLTTVDDGIYQAQVPQTVFAYSLNGNRVWYDLSNVGGAAFWGSSLEVKPSDGACEAIYWRLGQPADNSTQIKSCGAAADLTLRLCPEFCLPAWSPCGNSLPAGTPFRPCCTGHCIGSHHCIGQ